LTMLEAIDRWMPLRMSGVEMPRETMLALFEPGPFIPLSGGESFPVDPKTCRLNFLFPYMILIGIVVGVNSPWAPSPRRHGR